MAMVNILIALLVAVFRLTLCPSRLDCQPSVVLVKVCAEEYCHVVQIGFCHLQLMRHSFIVDVSVPPRYCFWLNCLLSLAGDIAVNPSPARFPCTVCSRPVCNNQRGIQCDGCQRWTHASCGHVSEEFYKQMECQVEFSWFCPSCLFLELPSCVDPDFSQLDCIVGSPCSNDSDTVETLPIITDVLCGNVTGVRLVHHNIQGLLSKSIDIHEWLEACVHSASVFCFTETWMKPEIPLPSVSGYQVFHSPFIARKSNVTGRYLPGSCLFISNNLLPEHPPVCVEIEN